MTTTISTIKTYQLCYNLKEMRSLDVETVKQIMLPRSGKEKKSVFLVLVDTRPPSASLPIIPSSTIPLPRSGHLLRCISNAGSPTSQMHPLCYVELGKWAAVTNFTFEETQDLSSADIRISFFKGDHDNGSPFDGLGGVLAHAFAPNDGRVHFDLEERWTNGIRADWIDPASVAVHKIGHLLGLGHNSEHDAVMFPYIDVGTQKVNLHPYDIEGIQSHYGIH
ncbi:PREDICTED: metalloendoproteinase 1-like [Nelumbo nucifera]|uniref:Metalloendoproteinase 1-like n=2 Tax=Nelumbo nucifera TaxID=4432 RepID=A0A1U8BAC4_NELNU|nr:PREDICTED: metalloendoproteinase 1-like [Nelumbo nucifera]DAD42607.1 TPA_asm: hypothetical protein HUJ06_000837 [Nelumbo nucifera]